MQQWWRNCCCCLWDLCWMDRSSRARVWAELRHWSGNQEVKPKEMAPSLVLFSSYCLKLVTKLRTAGDVLWAAHVHLLWAARVVSRGQEKQPRPSAHSWTWATRGPWADKGHNLLCSQAEVRIWNCLTFASSPPPEKQGLFLCLLVDFRSRSTEQTSYTA